MREKTHTFTEKITNLVLNNPIFESIKETYLFIISTHLFYRKNTKEIIFTETGFITKVESLILGFGNPAKYENNKKSFRIIK